MSDHPLNPEARRPLEDIKTAGDFILEWTKGVNEHRLWKDKLLRAAVERQFEVIAEALHRFRFLDRTAFAKLTDPENPLRLGDALRRDYDSIDYGILWRATRHDLPTLLREVRQLLANPTNPRK
jgi:uncharacterized protein with HEPN domain